MNRFNSIYKTFIFLTVCCLFFSQCTVKEVDDVYSGFPYIELGVQDVSIPKTEKITAIPVKTNRKLTVQVDPAQSGDTPWLTVSQSDDGKSLLISSTANDLEVSREARVRVETTNHLVRKEFKVVQDPSGELTIKGDLILKSHQDVLSNTYTKVSNALVLGNVSKFTTRASVPLYTGDYYLEVDESDINDESIDTLVNRIHEIAGRTLVIAKTDVTKFPSDLISNNRVDKVYIDYNKITDLPSNNELKTLSLSELSLQGNALTDISSLNGCSTIKHLDISYNDIQDLEVLFTLDKLKSLNISGLPITESQAEVYTERLENCSVQFSELRYKEFKLPVIDEVTFDRVSENAINIEAKIVQNHGGFISRAGFYIGNEKSINDMAKYVGKYSSATQTISYTYVTNNSDEEIFMRAYAECELGTSYGPRSRIGSPTIEGYVLLKDERELETFYNDNYLYVTGDLVVGLTTDKDADGYVSDSRLPSTYRYFKPSDISDIKSLSRLLTVSRGLHIVNTQVKDFSALSGLKDVRYLYLNANKMTTVPDFSKIQNLRELNLSRNKITDFTPVLALSGLQRLYLGNNEAPQKETNDIGSLAGLEMMQNLRYLDLSGLPLIEKQVEDLRQQLPNCNVIFVPADRPAHLPTVEIGGVTRTENAVMLTSTLVYNGKTPVTEYGFYIGKDLNSMTKVPVGGSINDKTTFSYEITVEEDETYYFYPYAVNSIGEGTVVDYKRINISNNDLSKYGTSNCYIVSEEGTYTFDASVKGNSNESVGLPASASVVWETKNTDQAVSVGDIVRNVSYAGGCVSFETTGVDGNALIAVNDASGNILWSWHIWVTDYNPQTDFDTYTSGAKMMDRNLGALNTEHGDVLSFGLFYQQGRKDPFVGCANVSNRTFAATAPAGIIKYVSSGSADLSIKNPHILYGSKTTTWAVDKGIYDPCPVGWKVPSETAWNGFKSSNKTTITQGVIYTSPSSSPDAYFPLTGDTQYGEQTLRSPGTTGYLWTTKLGYAYDFKNCTKASRDSQDENPVRCIREHDNNVLLSAVSVTEITKTTANLHGSISYLEKADVSEMGFVYSSTTQDPLTTSQKAIVSVCEGEFSKKLTDLKPGTTYYVRAYAIEGGIPVYGNVLSFTTTMSGGTEGLPEEDYEWE